MLQDKLKDISVILGSKSPRRKELLSAMDISFEVEVIETDESFDTTLDSVSIVKSIAENKLSAFDSEGYFDRLVICADTVVVDDKGSVLGKPANLAEAKSVISSLAGKPHTVYTAVAIAYRDVSLSFVEETTVWLNPLTVEEIDYYVERYKPLDKAGSYGIQEWIGRIGINKIVGSYENVIGLPTARLQQELKTIFK
ncbi:septum formation protein Maf [Sphingobacterium sp. DK4209]|uniref:dTTP/UTP pyrophosphatase n=1 Tax=Sphingobacterium zhuxiongii TaxID=2662364 RepID=A0A5Q0QCP3_9SPHI|nr:MULTISPECIES: Maf family protein [unclassified Sphingobacterium]MVZ64994.1 septum formation protein Maf [Sphingobacterium sp. DK4209]QGA25332.1 septum formation protein Maf [Sphingobacterium sp. dk4302]